MKVYTHFKIIDNHIGNNGKPVEDSVRWRTLLQYGESWEIIGSVVMMNPGSSRPLHKVTDQAIIDKLVTFDETSHEEWYEFTEDNAMRNVGELFALREQKKSRHELKGIIQIFNLFYIRDANLARAKETVWNIAYPSWFSTDYDIRCMTEYNGKPIKAPIYLGFGALAKEPGYSDKARLFWEAAQKRTHYLNPLFEKNKFYYPTYIMVRGKNRLCAQRALAQFIYDKYEVSDQEVEALRATCINNKTHNKQPLIASTKQEQQKTAEELFTHFIQVGKISEREEGFKRQTGIVFHQGLYEMYINPVKDEMLQLFFRVGKEGLSHEEKERLFNTLVNEYGFKRSAKQLFFNRLSLSETLLDTDAIECIKRIIDRINELLKTQGKLHT